MCKRYGSCAKDGSFGKRKQVWASDHNRTRSRSKCLMNDLSSWRFEGVLIVQDQMIIYSWKIDLKQRIHTIAVFIVKLLSTWVFPYIAQRRLALQHHSIKVEGLLHSLLAFSVNDMESFNDGSSPLFQSFGSKSEREELLRILALIIINEASKMKHKQFDHLDDILKDMQCRGSSEHHPLLRGITLLPTWKFIQELPVVLKTWWLEEGNENGRYINVHLRGDLCWTSGFWNQMKFWSNDNTDSSEKQLVIQGEIIQDSRKEHTLATLATFTHVCNELGRSLKALMVLDYNKIHTLCWFDEVLWSPINILVDEHNKSALEAYPVSAFNLRSSAKSETHFSSAESPGNCSNKNVMPEIKDTICPTSLPQHHLKPKIGAPVMKFRKRLHLDIVNEKRFLFSGHTRRVVHVVTVDTDDQEAKAFSLHRIKFLFSFHRDKIRRAIFYQTDIFWSC